MRLAQEGISVYSPHTAVDAAVGGLNDWLADIVTGSCMDLYVPPGSEALWCSLREFAVASI